jgi:preprotein translocase subunit SecF
MKNIQFIKYSKIWLFLSAGLAAVAVVFLVMWGLKWGIDFTGGSLMKLQFSESRPENTAVAAVLAKAEIGSVTVQAADSNGMIVRTATMTEEAHQKALDAIKKEFGTDTNKISEPSFEMIGPSVSQQLRQRSLWAIILVCLGIILYVAYAFRGVSRPVASWKYGLLCVVAMMHDVLIVLGLFALLGKIFGLEVDVAFVVAMLTILGYSVNDTIVVYDRIREKLLRRTSSESFEDLVNAGLNQTVMRSINTTLTTLFPLIALYFFGGATIHNFSLALLVGITAGAYSSIFIASPLLVYVERWQRSRLVKKA